MGAGPFARPSPPKPTTPPMHASARKTQETVEATVEGLLFSALRKTRLIPEQAEISSLQYSRCGRTDKGVSALGQVKPGGLGSRV